MIATRCRRCGREFEASGDDVRAGVWQTCPDCRDRREPDLPPVLPDERRARAMKPRAWWKVDAELRRAGVADRGVPD